MMFLILLSLFLFSNAVEGKEYTIVVATSTSQWSGTDATVKVRLHGTTRNIERALPAKIGELEKGNIDTFTIQDYDIGTLTGLDVYLSEGGVFDDWKLDKITVKIAGVPDSVFNYNDWVPTKTWIPLTLEDTNECVVNNPCTPQDACQNTVGSYVCNCDAGYELDPNDNNVCQVVQCPSLVAPAGRILEPARCSQDNANVYQDKCYVNCPSGYTISDSSHGILTCSSSKTWEGTIGTCDDNNECTQGPCDSSNSDCENLPGDYQCNCKAGYENLDSKQCQNTNECANGTHTCNTNTSDCADTEGDFRCSCKPGYTQGANNKLCDAVQCLRLVAPAGSVLEPARCTQDNANEYGDKCVMKCQPGYHISDISHGIVTCGTSGTWEGTMGSCDAVSCPKLPGISNGFLLPSICQSSGRKYTETCTYHCNSGYSPQGSSTLECLANGTWAGATPSCTKIEEQPWIRCPDLISQDLLPGKSTADVSSVWQEPTSNVQQITISPPEISSSYQFPPGETRVSWTASNSVGSENCSIYVIIYDTDAPTVINCPADIAETSDSSSKAVSWTEPTFSDNVKVIRVEKSHAPGSTFQLGSTFVSYDAFDEAGNNVQCRFKVELIRPPCHEPDGPVGGSKACNPFGVRTLCQLACPSGSKLYRGTTSFYWCSNGAWTPSDEFPDCVEASLKDPNTACQENQVEMTVTEVSTPQLFCGNCPTGMYKSSDTDCSPCPMGTYNDQQGQLQCMQQCQSGTSSLPGAKSASDCKSICSAGQYSDTGLGPNCQLCPRDSYQDTPQQKNCTACPNGTSTLSLGADSLSECGVKPNVNTLSPPTADINEGESVSVDCYASGVPTPVYIWKFLSDIPANFPLGQMAQSSLKNAEGEVIGARLTITNAAYDNRGSYECRVTNSHGEHMALVQINVEKVSDNGSAADEPL